MDQFVSSILRAFGALALATVFAVAGCVSEKGRAVEAADASDPDPFGFYEGATDPLDAGKDAASDDGGHDGAVIDDNGGAGGATADVDDDPSEPSDDEDEDLDAGTDDPQGDPTCERGFVVDGDECVRDLCTETDSEPAACADHGTCSDGTEATPTCDCDDGYMLESLECVRNACVQLSLEPLPCAENEDCTPTGPGTKTCSCTEGFDDCDDDPDNGCEAELGVNADHCGVCGLACGDDLGCDAGECETRVTHLALGFSAAIGTMSDGAVFGSGYGGALLDGHPTSTVPVLLSLDDASQVSINTNHACLVREDGLGAACWGSNSDYQLGGSTASDDYSDIALEGVRGISAGPSHTCLVADNGDVYCWGRGDAGQLGNGVAQSGGTRTFAATFAGSGYPVLNVTNATAVYAGMAMSCALLEDGSVYCWGRENSTIYQPELVRNYGGSPLAGVLELCTGSNHGCALKPDKTVVCWGLDSMGQLGSDTDASGRSRWVPVPLTNVSAVACGANHTCALHDDGEVSCWGQNSGGQFASGDAASSSTPIPALLPTGLEARAIYAGSGAVGTCFELTNGQLYCAGYNYYGQLGNGTSGAQQATTATMTEITSWP